MAITRTKLTSDRPKALLFKLDGSGDVRPLAPFPASDPAFSPDGSRIAVVRHSVSRRGKIETVHKDLYLTRADGTARRQLTDTRWVAETHPSWDPSGERIAFNSFRISRDPFEALFDELLPFGNSIVQINADGTCREKLISLRDAAVYGVEWQPGPGRGAGRIECGEPPAFALKPEGPRLALVKFNLPLFRFDLETIDETGAQPLRVAGGGEWTRPLPEWFTAPAWSPDGSTIVFAGVARRLFGGPKGTRLYVSGADGSDLRPLRGTHGADEPVFSPDGNTVAFTRIRFGPRLNRRGKSKFVAQGSSVWLVKLTGGPPKRITPVRKGAYVYAQSFSRKTEPLLRRADEPVFSPDGSRIAFVRWRPSKRSDGTVVDAASVFTVKAGGGGLKWLTDGQGNDFAPTWDPSGERLAFVRYRQAKTEMAEVGMGSTLMQLNADGSCVSTVLPRAPKTALYGPAWQPGPGREAGRIEC